MQYLLTEKLRSYIIQNNPELLLYPDENISFPQYLEGKVNSVAPLMEQMIAEGKPSYLIESVCMDELTKDLRPSRYNYIRSLLEEEFEADYERLRESGTLTYEAVNLVRACAPVFDQLKYSEGNEDNPLLHPTIKGGIRKYFESQKAVVQ